MSVSVPDAPARHWCDHPGWRGTCLIGRDGFSAPDAAELEPFALTEANRADLLARGVAFQGATVESNVIWLPRGAGGYAIRIRFAGSITGDNVIVVARAKALTAQLTYGWKGNLTVLAGGAAPVSVIANHSGPGAIFLGRDTRVERATLIAQGPGTSIQVGDGGLIERDVTLRTSDAHGVIDLDRPGGITNLPAHCIVEPYVLLQAGAQIMKGVRVGRGAIVGPSTVVARDVPPRCLVLGLPARVARERVTWTQALLPTQSEIQAAIARAGGEGQVDDASAGQGSSREE